MNDSTYAAVTLDASFVVAFCADAANRCAVVTNEIQNYANRGFRFYAPDVVVSECVFTICRKVKDNLLTAAEGTRAVGLLVEFMRDVVRRPSGDIGIARRALEIAENYGCSRMSDSMYLALAEQHAARGYPDLLTFDSGMENQAKANAPAVNVRVFARKQ